jgi:hypothetical protein
MSNAKNWIHKNCQFTTPPLPEDPGTAELTPEVEEPAPEPPEITEEPEQVTEDVVPEDVVPQEPLQLATLDEMINELQAMLETDLSAQPEPPPQDTKEAMDKEGFVFNVGKCDRAPVPQEKQVVAKQILSKYLSTGEVERTGDKVIDGIVQTELSLMGTQTTSSAPYPVMYPVTEKLASRRRFAELAGTAQVEELSARLEAIRETLRSVRQRGTEPERTRLRDPEELPPELISEYKNIQHEFYSIWSERENMRISRAEELGRIAKTDPSARVRLIEELDLKPRTFLDSNPKLEKGKKLNWSSFGLSLAPGTTAGLGKDMCPFRTKWCSKGCLSDSGQAERFSGTHKGELQLHARRRKTWLYMRQPEVFYPFLDDAIKKRSQESEKVGNKLCIRLNVLSDQPWEDLVHDYGEGPQSVIERNPNVNYYDYTKSPHRFLRYIMAKRGQAKWPPNYHLTLSLSEINLPLALWALENGGNVSAIFDTPANMSRTRAQDYRQLPQEAFGHPVVDGDIFDMRFLDHEYFSDPKVLTDPWIRERGVMNEETVKNVSNANAAGKGLIVGLRAKGIKFKDHLEAGKSQEREQKLPFGSKTGGLVLYSDDAGMDPTHRSYNHSLNKLNNPDVVAEMLAASESRRLEQKSGEQGARFIGIPTGVQSVVYPELIESLSKKFGSSFQQTLKNRVPTLFSGWKTEASTKWVFATCAFH